MALQQSSVLEAPSDWARFTRTPELPVQPREELPAEAPLTPSGTDHSPQHGPATTLFQLQKKLSGARLSLTFLREQIRMSEVPSVGAIATLLREHASDLAAYLSSDPKGSLVPKFLEQLGAELAREQALLQKECEQLARSLDEIRGLLDERQAGRRSKESESEPGDSAASFPQQPFSFAASKA